MATYSGELINLNEPNGMPLGEFIPLCQQLVAERFFDFLVQYCKPAISLMCSDNESILPIDYCLLITKDVTLAHYTNEAPREMVVIFNKVLPNVVRSLHPMYVCNTLKVAIANMPLNTEFSDLSRLDLIGKLVRLDVIVVSKKNSTAIAIGHYNCGVCKFVTDAILGDVLPYHCGKCQNKNVFKLNTTLSTFKSIAELHVQNVHNTSINHIMRCHADSDLCKHVLVGSNVIITGVYTRSPGSKIFQKDEDIKFEYIVDVLHVAVVGNSKINYTNLTDEDIYEIIRFSKRPGVFNEIVNSIGGESIFGNTFAKTCIALSLFGGVRVVSEDHSVRGDIHVLLCGDPGTAKSQLLVYLIKNVERCILVSGKNSSAVGLTACMRKNPDSKEWGLQAGALVLASGGTCLIDEFDKMDETDMAALHEAMERQTITISKSSVNTTLITECSVIAAMNPIDGHYRSDLSFKNNVVLLDSIISRFDMICIFNKDLTNDADIANFVLQSHQDNHPNAPPPEQKFTSSAFLRKYINYAKFNFHPKMGAEFIDHITAFYNTLRQFDIDVNSMPITTRIVESIIRLSTASAKMYLRNKVKLTDVEMGISVILESYLSTLPRIKLEPAKLAFRRFLQSSESLTWSSPNTKKL